MYLLLPDWDYDPTYNQYDFDDTDDGYYVKVNGEDCGYECVKGFQFSYLPLVIIAVLLYQRRYVSTFQNLGSHAQIYTTDTHCNYSL